MRHLQTFNQFINEAIDLRSAYPFRVESGGHPYPDGTIGYITYGFKTDGGSKYHVSLTLSDEIPDETEYDFFFSTEVDGQLKSSKTQTGEHDALRVFATVTAILKNIIETKKLKPFGIRIKGANKPGENDVESTEHVENSRDRIYKHVARREVASIHKTATPGTKGYRMHDKGKDGLLLTPVFDQQRRLRPLSKENEGITMFDDKTEKVL